MISTKPNMSKSIVVPLIAFIATAVIEFIAAAAIQFRLFPFLQADTVKFGRGGNPIPTDQFVAWAVPILIGLGCLSIVLAAYLVILRKKKVD